MNQTPLHQLLSDVDLATLRAVITPRDDLHELANWYAWIADFMMSEIEARMAIALCREFLPEIRDERWPLAVIRPQYKTNQLHPRLHYQLDFLVTCEGRRIGVECDGKEFHSSHKQMAMDQHRSRKISELSSVKIIRFTGTQIYQEAELCARRVRRELYQ